MISILTTVTTALAMVTIVLLIAKYRALYSALILSDLSARLLPSFVKPSFALTYLFLLTPCLCWPLKCCWTQVLSLVPWFLLCLIHVHALHYCPHFDAFSTSMCSCASLCQ